MAILGLHRRQTGYEPAGFGAFQAPLQRNHNSECKGMPGIQWRSSRGAVELAPGGDALPVVPGLLKRERILVPFDFSWTSVRLLRRVAAATLSPGTRVSVLHVVSAGAGPSRHTALCPFELNRERLQAARALLSRLLGGICPEANRFTAHVLAGPPIEEIVRFARAGAIDLIVMTAHGERTLEHLSVAATTERVTRRSPCPVLVLPETVLFRDARDEREAGSLMAGFRRILVPVDFSASSAAALRGAAAIAQEQNAELCVLHFFGAGDGEGTEAGAAQRLRRWVGAHLDFVGNLRTIVRPGNPSAYLLLRQAGLLETDLLAFSPRDYSWAERLRLSSSTDAILRHAHCPVLSIRPETLNAGR